MISERDFVLNNFFQPCFEKSSQKDTLFDLKDNYKFICENTSDINADSFWLDGYERIKFAEITKVTNLGSEILEVKCIGMLHQLFGEDIFKFKQWFERKRG